MNLKKTVSRRDSKLNSVRNAYESLEPRRLLAVAIGTDSLQVSDAAHLVVLQHNSTIDYTLESDLVSRLAKCHSEARPGGVFARTPCDG